VRVYALSRTPAEHACSRLGACTGAPPYCKRDCKCSEINLDAILTNNTDHGEDLTVHQRHSHFDFLAQGSLLGLLRQ